MSRGRKPLMALREAVLIAQKRGEVRQFMHEPGLICNFIIYCLGFTALVRIKRVTRVRCSHVWIEAEAADALASLRAIAPGTGISCELWVFLPRGAFRFFRVEATGLVELNRDGTEIAPKTWDGRHLIPVRLDPPRYSRLRHLPPGSPTLTTVKIPGGWKMGVTNRPPVSCPDWQSEPVYRTLPGPIFRAAENRSNWGENGTMSPDSCPQNARTGFPNAGDSEMFN
jgi:hypothetical protein